MNLSKQVQDALMYIQSIDVSQIENPVEAGRSFYEEFIPMAGEPEAIFRVEDVKVLSLGQEINVRIYRPSDKSELPVVLYFHGGWFNAGSLESHDRPLRRLAKLSGAIFVSVDYRLAPEHPFPCGLNDGIGVLNWIAANAKRLGVDLKRMAISGDSAGGAIAAAVTRIAIKENNYGIICQALIYPVTDSSLQTPSWQEYKDGPVLNYQGAVEAWKLYLGDSSAAQNKDASPLYAEDLSEMPSTLIIVAEHDPLKDEAILYASKLQKSGVEVRQSMYKGMIHGFFQMGGVIDEGNRAIEETASFLIDSFNK